MDQIIIVWCLLSIVNCFRVYKGIKTQQEVKSLIDNSIFNSESIIPTIYIAVIVLAPLFFIVKLIQDLKKIAKK